MGGHIRLRTRPLPCPGLHRGQHRTEFLGREAYSTLNEFHAPAAASNGPGPGPLLNSAECTSGGAAIQIGAVIESSSGWGYGQTRGSY